MGVGSGRSAHAECQYCRVFQALSGSLNHVGAGTSGKRTLSGTEILAAMFTRT